MVQTIEAGKTRIGWVGTGVMGRWMCQHIMDAGYSVTVHNRTPEKAKPLLEAGATWADTPAQVAAVSDVIFTIVGFPEDVRQVVLGPEGTLAGAAKGAILVDMTTTSPSLAVEISEAAEKKGVYAVDAPVSGGDVGAREARLSIMVGGDKDAVDAIMPLFSCMGKSIIYQGKAGSGQHTKMCNQITIAGTMIGVCEALLYGARAGLDLEVMLSSISKGAAGCWTLDNLAPRVLRRNFDPGFFIEHFLKDMQIALDEARRMRLPLLGLALVHQLYTAAQAQGHGRAGTHALILALEKLAGQQS
ncbi:MAG: NAD(P)-dependent oxidoreductase [Myxococcales bacterium]|nr:NAD(P)-dependent oxidoreductase [Myxococcales bacterium]